MGCNLIAVRYIANNKMKILFFILALTILLVSCNLDKKDSIKDSLNGIWVNDSNLFIFKDSLAKSNPYSPFRPYVLLKDTLKILDFSRNNYHTYKIIRKTEQTLWLVSNNNISDTIALQKYNQYKSDHIRLDKLVIRFDEGTINFPIFIDYVIEINSNKRCYYKGDISSNTLANRIGVPEEPGYYEGSINDKEYKYLQNLLINVPLGSLKNIYKPYLSHHYKIDLILYLKIKERKDIKRLTTTINGPINVPRELNVLVSYLLEVKQYARLKKVNNEHKFELELE